MKKSYSYFINPNYLLREIANEYILVPVGQAAVDFNGLATLNATSAWLWKYLQKKATLQDIIMAFAHEYEISVDQSTEDVTDFLKQALEHHLVIKDAE